MKITFFQKLKTTFSQPLRYAIALLFLFFFLMFGKLIRISIQEVSLSLEIIEGVTTFSSYFLSDSVLFFGIVGITYLSSLSKKKRIQALLLLFIFGIFLLYGIDMVAHMVFYSNVPIIEMSKFFHSSPSAFSSFIFQILLLFIVSLLWMVLLASTKFIRTVKVTLLIFPFFLLVFSSVFCLASDIIFSLPTNIITTNIKALQASALPSANIPSPGHTDYTAFFTKEQGKNKQPNIIIILAESLSPIDSLRVGQVNDNLPYFDTIAQEGITFTNYINNGCTSDTAHIALLKGIEPLDVATYTGFQAPLESLPEFLNTYGYDTTFLSSVPLTFLNQRAFLEEMQFNHIIGEEAFAGQKQYVFDAAPDENLYSKALELLAEKSDLNQPYALMMQTISFHKPYNTPYGNTQEDALRYADEALGRFYKRLKLSHFFDNGIIIIIGDHRKMEAQEKGEKEILGDFRYAKGLATIVGTGIMPNRFNKNIIQHTDVYNGIRKLVATGEVLVSELANDTFSPAKQRDRGFLRCAFFSTNQYSLIQENGTGLQVDTITDLYAYQPFQNYLSLYLTYQHKQNNTQPLTSQQLIAHAGGEIEGKKYTNSLEALDYSYQQGAKLFELDILETADKKLIAAHDTTTPSTLDIEGINNRFAQHPDAILVTDKINNPQRMFTAFAFPERLMMELFSRKAIEQAKQLWITPMVSENLLFTTPDIEQKLTDLGLTFTVFSRNQIAEHKDLLQRLKAQGIKNYAFLAPYETGKDEAWLRDYGKEVLYGIYADSLWMLTN